MAPLSTKLISIQLQSKMGVLSMRLVPCRHCLFRSAVIYLFLLAACTCIDAEEIAAPSYGKLYVEAKKAYEEHRWSDCAELLDSALAAHRIRDRAAARCRYSCRAAASRKAVASAKCDYPYGSFASLVEESHCIRACGERIGFLYDSHDAASRVEFQRRVPYDYLQLCLHKVGNNPRAAAAAFTFASANPHREDMAKNLQFYSSLPDVSPTDFFDMEQSGLLALYKSGTDAYVEEDWPKALSMMTQAAMTAYEDYLTCSFICEGDDKEESGVQPSFDFVSTIAGRTRDVAHCKAKCEKLIWTSVNGATKVLPLVHHFLQYISYKVGDLATSCRHVGTYLLFEPTDSTMLKNKNYFLSQHGVTESSFAPLQEAVWYVRELRFLQDIFRDALVVSDESLSGKNVDDSRVNMSEAQLGGKERFVADEFVTEDECSELIRLCKREGTEGDGYEDKHPHTEHETFEGLTVSRAVELHRKGVISNHALRLYLELSEKARKFVATYFRTNELYFDYTHLVCRTAIHEGIARTDVSHQVHSDNCHLQVDGSCPRVRPAYIQRDYSALLYLNGDFDGGEFFFSNNRAEDLISVKPKCGRLVSFNASTFHGVKAVIRGSRCAVAMWFTMDRAFDERSRLEASVYLKNAELNGLQKDEL